MKGKKGYKLQKGKFSTGKWLKRYYEKFTCRKRNKKDEEYAKEEVEI